jgi:hypothetical protein
LRGADLTGADLTGANLINAYLTGAYLRGAELRGAELRGANLIGANLTDADLTGAAFSWQSHALLAEILFRAAGEDCGKRGIAGLVLISIDWCWDKFLELVPKKYRAWAKKTLLEYSTEKSPAPQKLRDWK